MSGVLIRCIALLLLVLAAGCTESGVRPYPGTWEYRYGRSPVGSDGVPLWSLPPQAYSEKSRDSYRDGWATTQNLYTPPGRNRQDRLWLRTKLTGPVLREPVLGVQAADERCQAFLDGRELPCFGSFEERALRSYPGKDQVLLPLGADYVGKTLVLHFYSPYQSIGVYGSLILGEQRAVLVELVQLGIPVFAVAIILIALGVGVLCLFAIRRSEIDYLQFAGLSLTVGIYLLSRTPMRSLLIDAPLGWRRLELTAFALMGTLLGWFVARMVGDTRLGLLRLQAWLMLLYSALTAGLIAAGMIHIESGLRGLQLLWGLLLITVVALSVIGAMRGSSDARVLGIGILLGGLLAIYELLMTLGFLPRTVFLVPHAIGVLILTQGVLLARRFLAIHKRLGDYSSVLQLSFTAVSDPEPGQHAHIALREIVRVLECERALLFLPNPSTGALEISAQHTADGAPVQGPADAPAYDRSLVELVQRQLRPLFREPSATSMTARRGIVATPLLARGTTLGVLYLEATPGRRAFTREDAELLSGLGNQLVLLQMIARAVRLEVEGLQARQRLTEQSELLAAAGRMAKGDLMTPISVPAQSNLAVLAQALDEMRQDLLRQIRTLEANNLEIRELNEELRRQIEQRSRRLMEIVLKMEHGPRTAATAFQPGQILGEHYRIVGLIGQGASGQVFEVERTTDGRHLAAKVLSGRADQLSVVRFAREAQILARVSHPNLVAIMDVDLTTAGVLFIVMERVRGTPLHRLTDRYGALGFTLPVLRQIASALQVVHAQGIVHRDLKPANVVIAEEAGGPQAKLLDFGVASLADARGGQAAPGTKPAAVGGQSEVGILLGTPMYLAPELAEGSHLASPASDVFSFGVIAFELLTRFLPFAQPPVVTRYRKERLAVSALLKVRPDLAQAFADRNQALLVTGLIERCLSEDAGARPSAAEIASVLGTAAVSVTLPVPGLHHATSGRGEPA